MPNTLSHKCIRAPLSWECWKEVTVYADLIRVLSPVFCSCGLVQAWGEKILKCGEVLGSLKCWNSFSRVSRGSGSSAFELPAQFRSVLILTQVFQHCCVNSLYRFRLFSRQWSIVQDFCTLLLKCPLTAWVSQNRRFLIFLFNKQFGYWV